MAITGYDLAFGGTAAPVYSSEGIVGNQPAGGAKTIWCPPGAFLARIWSVVCADRQTTGIALILVACLGGWANAKDIAVAELTFEAHSKAGRKFSCGDCYNSSEQNWLLGGLVSAPIGDGLGLQVDVASGQLGDKVLASGSAHLFTREPESFLVGVFASTYVQETGPFDRGLLNVGVEAEFYIGDVTVLAQSGYRYRELSTYKNPKPFAGLHMKWYLDENLVVNGGATSIAEGEEDQQISRAGLEWMPELGVISGLSVRLDWSRLENRDEALLAGLTYHFGHGATLKRQDREYVISRDPMILWH